MKNVVLLLAALGLMSACNRQGAANNQAAAVTDNQAGAPAAKAEPGPDLQAAATAERDVRALLDRIYAPYATDNAPGREIASFMEPQLAAAMSRSEDGIEVDPFIAAQDYAPFRPDIGAIEVNGDRAEAAVTIDSLGRRTLHYSFVRTPGGWKIADIRAPDGPPLRQQYGLPPLS